MSLTYNGTTSTFKSSSSQTAGNLLSFSAWFNATTEGEGNFGAIFAFDPNVQERGRVLWDGSATKKLRIDFMWNVYATWVMTSGFAAIGKWLWMGLTYDYGSTANDPILYTLVDSTFSTLTVGSGLTESAAPVGTAQTDNRVLNIGALPAGDGTWDGLIGEFALWKRILTPSEMQAVAFNGVNVCPDHFNYLPQDGGSVQNLGSSGTTFTASNTTTGENPPMRPAGRKG